MVPSRIDADRSGQSRARGALIVGAGAAGLLHALSFRAHGVPVVAVFDPDRARAERLADLVGGPRVLDTFGMVAQCKDVDCVSICSPPPFHVEQAEMCATNGENHRLVFVEKPVAITRNEMARLDRLRHVVPVVQWRTGRSLRAVRRAVAEGFFGPAPSVAIDLAWHRDAHYFARNRARYDQWGCGALLSIGIHALDAVCFALDRPITEVHGMLGFTAGIEVETGATLALAFRGGALASLRITFEAAHDRTRITFCGAGVTATINGTEADPTANEIEFAANDPVKERALRALACDIDGVNSGPLLVPFIGAAVDAFCRGLTPGAPSNIPSIRDVAMAHAAIFRLYESYAARQ
ncbi:MAG TPA: Gfo/Idh/MocA family oxidoreductase [Polyangiaceae bacterium]|nr:Gfo/Idh/MocA family oxidoreductase [Polyangiaceae bacterium]